MSVNFAYSRCLEGTQESRAMEALASQKFSYGDVTYSEYSEAYKPNPKEALIFSKVVAPLCFIGFGIVKSVYHLALVVFKGIPRQIANKDSSSLKYHLYTAVRNAELGTGWLVRIFHDQMGSFLIEDAQHHLSQYKFFIEVEDDLDQSAFLEKSRAFDDL